jgi:hypothetical protein
VLGYFTVYHENIKDLIEPEQFVIIENSQFELIRKFQYCLLLSNFIYMLPFLGYLFDKENPRKQMIHSVYWLLWISMMGLTIYSKRNDKPKIIKFIQFLLLVRNLLPFVDWDDKRTEFESGAITLFLVIQIFGVTMI